MKRDLMQPLCIGNESGIQEFSNRDIQYVASNQCVITRDGYRLVFIRYRYITDTFKTIPVPKRCRNRYFYKKIKKCLRLTTFKKGFIAKYMNCLK